MDLENRHQPFWRCLRIITTYQNPSTPLDLRSSASILFSKVEHRVCRSWSGYPRRDPPLTLGQNVSTANVCFMLQVFQAQNMPHSGYERQLPDNVLALLPPSPCHVPSICTSKAFISSRCIAEFVPMSWSGISSTCGVFHTTYPIVTVEEAAPMMFGAPRFATIVHHRRT